MRRAAKLWIDGRIVGSDGRGDGRGDGADGRVSALDRGFQYGDGVFETMRVERGRVFFLDEHLERMRRGLCVLGIGFPGAGARAHSAVRDLVAAFPADAVLTVKVVASRGLGPAGPTSRGEFEPTLVVCARPDTSPRPGALTAVTSSVVRNERSPIARVKSLNYLEMLLARAEAERAGADEAIVLGTRGQVAEASAANVFAVSGGRVVTPPVEDGCLPGIVRAAVICQTAGLQRAGTEDAPLECLSLKGRLGIELSCESLAPAALASADEAFLTNSRIGVTALVELDGRPIGRGEAGAVTLRIREAFREAELASGTALHHQDTKDTKDA